MGETASLPHHMDLGRRDCFHDELNALNCVRNVLSWVDRDGRKSDTVTPQIVRRVLETTLIEKDDRYEARQIRSMLSRILHDAAIAGNPAVVSPRHKSEASPFSPGTFSPESTEPSSPQKVPALNGTALTDPHVTTTGLPLGTQQLSPRQPPTIPEHIPNRPSINDTRPLRGIPVIEKPSPPGQPPKAPTSTVPGQDMRTSLPPVTFQELQQWIADRKQGNKRGLPGWESAKRSLEGRDFVSIPLIFNFNT